MIKQIKIREFQRHFCKVKFEDCEVLDSSGVLIGTWKPANNGLQNTVRQDFEKCPTTTANRLEQSDKMAKLKALQGRFDVRHTPKVSDNIEKMASAIPSDSFSETEFIRCELCKKEKAEVYEIWEEGEERKTCRDCIALRVPPKLLTGILRRSKRL